MIHADGNQHSQFGILHNIGGIQIAEDYQKLEKALVDLYDGGIA